MAEKNWVFDHVHLVSENPKAAADWYVEMLGGKIVAESEMRGAPSVVVSFKGATIIIRGQRTGEEVSDRAAGVNWGVDHFGLTVAEGLDELCDELKSKGVVFTMDPVDFGQALRISFCDAPDNVSIELMQRK